ncbi:hypothetical protein BCR33DRAFT_720291, partial [Rhizoclosmatium globosum]
MQFQLVALAIAAIANAQTIQFPQVCSSQCAQFGTALTGSCMTSPTSTDVSVTANKIAACFCGQYSQAASGGSNCANCIGNAASLSGKNSTQLFINLVALCANDISGGSAAPFIAPIIKDAVLANVVTTTAGASSTGAAVVAGTTTKSGAVELAMSAAAIVAALSLF